MDFFNVLGKKITNAAQGVQEKTADGIETTKISNELRSIRGEVQKLYTSLGELYYKTASKSAEGEIRTVCDEIDKLMAKTEELNARKKEIAMKGHCPTCGKSVKSGSNFCANCGTKIEVPEEEPEQAEEKAEPDCCPDCGTAVRPGIRFCTNCGHSFVADEESAVNLETAAEEPADTQE